MTKKAQNMLKEKMNKRRSETKLEKEKTRKNKLAKKHKNRPQPLNLKSAQNNELKEEFERVQESISKRPGKDIKNKQKRQDVILQRAQRKKQIKAKMRRNKQKIREEQGDDAVETTQVKTIDNQREHDDTYVQDDEDIEEEKQNDEFTSFYNKEYDPQILITTSIKHTSSIFKFIKAIKDTIPNVYFYYRKNRDIAEMITFAKEKGFTTILVVTEECKKPYRITIGHLLGKGLTVEMKITDLLYRDDISGAGLASDHNPEVLFKNFKTKLGFRVQRILHSLFPLDEQLEGRRVITFHNQRDYIFFRHYRYQFKEEFSGVKLQELGPSFTLRLLSIQEGLFDREIGNYEYNYKDRMGIRRRKFYL